MKTTERKPLFKAGDQIITPGDNRATVICQDYTGMNRPINYAVFTDRVPKIPTQEEFEASMQDNYKGNLWRHVFAIWDWEATDYINLTK